MERIGITDITMRYCNDRAGFPLSFREKIELAKLLDKLGVSCVEVSPAGNKKIDNLLIKSIASAVKGSCVAVPVDCVPGEAARVMRSLAEARHPRLVVSAPVSVVQMEYLAGKKPKAMLAAVSDTLAECRAVCPDVEFIAEDATRADPAFLAQILDAAVKAGASTVTVSDTAGAMLPDEFSAFLTELTAAVPALEGVTLGVSCADDLSMADSCAVAAIRAGAREIKTVAYPANTVRLADIARIISVKGHSFGVSTDIRVTEIKRILESVERMCAGSRSANSPFDAGVREENGDVLTAHDDMEAVSQCAARLGYELSEDDTVKVYEAFLAMASKKEAISSRELDAIIASAAMQVPPAYRLESYVVNTGNTISATAHLRLVREGKTLEGISLGDGPIDAAFLAIESIVGRHYELDDFQIQAITEGREAMGESVVKLRREGRVYSGRGLSTDIVGSSIQAYLNALNKIVFEESGEAAGGMA